MSKLLEFFLGSILITVFTVAFLLFSALHYILRVSGIGDCVWQGSAKTWVDLNGDGLVNHAEPPLGNVAIHIDDVNNWHSNISWPAVTDEYGDVHFTASVQGCTDTVFEVYVNIPDGYRLTTSPRIEVNDISGDFWSSLGRESVYYFGFAPEK
jgi:hypothetical protein